jgi:flagellar biosynthetic protein FliR
MDALFEFLTFTAAKLQTLMLVIMRGSGLLILAPIIGSRQVPVLVRVGLLLVLALVLVPVVGETTAIANSTAELTVLALKEILVGVLIGLFFIFIFFAAKVAGGLVGYQIGFAIAVQLDPTSGDQVSLIGRFWDLMASLIFIAISGHHLIIRAFADSYLAIPPGVVVMNGSVGEMVMKYSAYVFVLALKMAAPVLVTLFLTDVALGTVAKTMPTMNVFFVGFPVKIGVGLLTIALALPLFSYVLERAVDFLDGELRTMMLAMGQV